jgi:hypothetical protein
LVGEVHNPVKFEGALVMPEDQPLACTRNFNLDTYAAAFGGELAWFRKALQALFYFTDHVALDLSGGRVKLTQPIDVAALSGLTSFGQRRVLAPKGSAHSIAGLSVTGNVFREGTGAVDRVEMVDTTHATLNAGNYRNLVFANNTFNGITQATVSPILVEHTQNTADQTWVLDAGNCLPFGVRARNVESHVLEGPARNAEGTVQWVQPYVEVEQGAGDLFVHLRWPSAVRCKAMVKVRCDNSL